MTRRYITNEIWNQLQQTMTSKGCYQVKNSREVTEYEPKLALKK